MAQTTLTVVTGNKNKAAEIEAITGFPVVNVVLDIPEIQSLNVVEVARAKAQTAFEALKVPVVVDDTGLRIDALQGLPGALVAWFLDTIGPEGILRMMSGQVDRAASVSTCIAYCDGKVVETFEGVIEGHISTAAQGNNGFGYDPIFIPRGSACTYAEMSMDEKSQQSMRSVALAKLKRFLDGYIGS